MVKSHAYNAANQVDGWQYDAAGNLLGDSTTSYSYDALNRLLTTSAGAEQRAYTYNGDNALVQQTANGVSTRLTQDLVSPLSQVLQTTANSTTTDYVYGHDRLLKLDGLVRTWYGGDALGSVRQTLDDAGAPLSAQHYDPVSSRTRVHPAEGDGSCLPRSYAPRRRAGDSISMLKR